MIFLHWMFGISEWVSPHQSIPSTGLLEWIRVEIQRVWSFFSCFSLTEPVQFFIIFYLDSVCHTVWRGILACEVIGIEKSFVWSFFLLLVVICQPEFYRGSDGTLLGVLYMMKQNESWLKCCVSATAMYALRGRQYVPRQCPCFTFSRSFCQHPDTLVCMPFNPIVWPFWLCAVYNIKPAIVVFLSSVGAYISP